MGTGKWSDHFSYCFLFFIHHNVLSSNFLFSGDLIWELAREHNRETPWTLTILPDNLLPTLKGAISNCILPHNNNYLFFLALLIDTCEISSSERWKTFLLLLDCHDCFYQGELHRCVLCMYQRYLATGLISDQICQQRRRNADQLVIRKKDQD